MEWRKATLMLRRRRVSIETHLSGRSFTKMSAARRETRAAAWDSGATLNVKFPAPFTVAYVWSFIGAADKV
jgi:hypothetical protein